MVVGNNTTIPVKGTGTLSLWIAQDHGVFSTAVSLRDVLYVPGIAANLLSVRTLAAAGFVCVFRGVTAILTDVNGQVWATARQNSHDGFYRLWTKPLLDEQTTAAMHVSPLLSVHHRSMSLPCNCARTPWSSKPQSGDKSAGIQSGTRS